MQQLDPYKLADVELPFTGTDGTWTTLTEEIVVGTADFNDDADDAGW